MWLLFFFALPLMFGNIFQQLYTVVDTAIVGRGVSMDALAALGTVDWLNWMILGIAQGFTQGFSVRMSQKYGQGDIPGLRRTIGVSVRLTIVITVLCMVFSQLFLGLFLNLLRVPAELRGMATTYTRILFAGIPAVMFYNFTSSVLRSIGNSKTPLIAMIIAAFTNIALDSLTVFVLGWGVAGAAIATVFSQCLSGAICALKIARTPDLHFSKSDMKREPEMSKTLLSLGIPVAVQNTIISIGGMAVQTIVNGFGMTFIAGFTATNKLYGILEIAAVSYGYAVTTYVGQNYGAGQWDRIRKGMTSAAVLSVLTSLVIAAVMLIFGRDITMLFIESDVPEIEAAAGETAYMYLTVMSVFLAVLYLLHAYRSALQGMGNTVIPMISGIIEFVMRVGVAAVIGMTGYANGIFYAEVAAWAGAALILIISYYRSAAKLGRNG